MSEDGRNWTQEVALAELTVFTDYWHAAPGQRGVKLDWFATFRNWCRRSNTPSGTPQTGKPLNDPATYRQFVKDQIARATERRDYAGVRSWRQKLEQA